MGQPTLTRYGGRTVARFGNVALPRGQGIMTPVDLNDYVNTLLVEQFRSDDANHQIQLAQLLYRARSAYLSEDFGPRAFSLPMLYVEDSTHFVGGFLAQLSQAGEQQLSFDRGNLLTLNQGSLETDTTGWAVDSNCTIARTTAQALDGVASLQITSVASGNMKAITPGGTSGIAVLPNTQYTAVASFRSAVSARTCVMTVLWYDAAGSFISNFSGAGVADTTTGWTQITATGVSPANAAFAALDPQVSSTGAGAEIHYMDRISLAPGSSTAWSPGGSGSVYILARYQGATNRMPARPSLGQGRPLAWSFDLQFLCANPWFQDAGAQIQAPVAITTDTTFAAFSIAYTGSVFCEPIITYTHPASDTKVVNQIVITNTMSGEALTVNFLSVAALPASTARTVTIDTALMTAVDGVVTGGYDVTGSFPRLYGPVGTSNPFTIVTTTAAGQTAGCTLGMTHYPRWEI